MRIIGLTGSIGMGKSFVAKEFIRCGIPVFDADKTVRALWDKLEVREEVARIFPGNLENGEINRKAIASEVFKNRTKRLKLEDFLHPLVFKEQHRFLCKERKKGCKLVVLEIPLLFENGVEKRCDGIIVTISSLFLQEKRVLSRPSMTREKLKAVRAIQLNNVAKRKKADFVIYTGLGKAHTRGLVHSIIRKGLHQKGKK